MVAVGVGVSVGAVVAVMGVTIMISGVLVAVSVLNGVDVMIIGVGVTTPGVRDGIGVHTGNGCGWTVHRSQEVSTKAQAKKMTAFFMASLYTGYSCPVSPIASISLKYSALLYRASSNVGAYAGRLFPMMCAASRSPAPQADIIP